MGNGPIDFSLGYRYPMISEGYAFRVSNNFRTIFRQITSDFNLRICQVDVVSEYDSQMMHTWNPKEPFATRQEMCMHNLVQGRIREIPNSQAVCAWDGSLTYSQLDMHSNVAARRLTCLGIGPGVYVPFAFEKSKWAVVASLGILKAGGAFVPLNPRDPRARLTEILRNVNADVVVTMEAFVATFEGLVRHIEVISTDTMHHRPITEGLCEYIKPNGLSSSHIKTVSPKDPIFVLFTSGSTGKPKGMIHEHRAICTHATTHGGAMGYHGARVLQFAAHTFDVAIIDIFTTLIFGGCICIPSEEDRRNNIVEVINNMRVDYVRSLSSRSSHLGTRIRVVEHHVETLTPHSEPTIAPTWPHRSSADFEMCLGYPNTFLRRASGSIRSSNAEDTRRWRRSLTSGSDREMGRESEIHSDLRACGGRHLSNQDYVSQHCP